MNKSQELDIMIIRAKQRAEEIVKQHKISWYGEKVEETSGEEIQNSGS